jgi:RNA polymerase sigma-B factor
MTSTTVDPSSVRAEARNDVDELALRWRRDGDPLAREALVRRFMPLARSLARRYARSSTPIDDLVQVASIGLLKAIDRFDPERGGTLQAYAIPTILGELRRYFRDSSWGVHVPRGAQERALAVRDVREHLTNQNGQSPTVNQLAQYMEVDTEQVLDGLQALHAYETAPLDAPRGEDGDHAYIATHGCEEEGFRRVENLTALGAALQELPELEREILGLRFFGELTQREIAERVGVSQMQVSRLLRRTLETLRMSLDEERQEALPAP